MATKESYREELRTAIRQLTDRCLHSASKWAAEQLVGLGVEQDPSKITPSHSRFQRDSSSIRRRFLHPDVSVTPTAGVSYVSTPLHDEDDAFENDCVLLAKTYFNCKEYRRAAHVLKDQKGKKAVFLRSYSLYMAGEKRKEEEMIELDGPLGKSDAVNTELSSLEKDFAAQHRNGTIDAFGLYLYGVVLKSNRHEDLARAVLVESVNRYPWNWNAWSELQHLCTTSDILNGLDLKNHWMRDFFLGVVYQELRMHTESLAKFEYLQRIFGFSNYIQAQIAKTRYSLRDFQEVEYIFEELQRNDPYRIDDMDMYSNVLYAKECCATLSHLAHKIFLIDKYRPESCCIIGNYYSLKGQHEKSVIYFRRALQLNRNYLSAWTLMGHEYVEMKNTPAAVDAYRRAVDINPCDYRAWYGLGQAYEMMNMPYYALYYFKKSVNLQPNDSRLWIAMANCYDSDELHMLEDAIKCYQRAVNCNDSEAIALHQLGKLHNELGRKEEAAFYYKKDLERMEAEELEGPNMVEALLFLAAHCKSEKRFEEAEIYCTRLLDFTGPEKEVARSLLRSMRVVEANTPSSSFEHFPS